ncbi:ABC transporter permease [Saliphagus sp. GCM10025334]
MEVRDYVIRRVLYLIPTIFLVTLITFGLTRISGVPIGAYVSAASGQEQVEAARELYGLDEPLWKQYLIWMRGILTGDWGWSTEAAAPVTQALIQKAPASFELAIAGIIMAGIISITLGTLAGKYQDTWIDHFSRALAIGGMSTPQFWAGLMLILVGYVYLGWFPLGRSDPAIYATISHPTGFYTLDALLNANLAAFWDAVWHLFLPALTIGYAESAVITRHLRSEIVEKKREEYADAARARGVKEGIVFAKHIRRNALIPTVTVAGLSFAFLLRGIVVVELVFAWPGLGRWVANAAVAGDAPAIMGFILLVGVSTILVNLGVDVTYAYLDPRVELGE